MRLLLRRLQMEVPNAIRQQGMTAEFQEIYNIASCSCTESYEKDVILIIA
jgi:hypothetical protein